MSTPGRRPAGFDRSGGEGQRWPIDKLNALRLGQRLVAEVPSSQAGRRAFVDIRPLIDQADTDARRDGWKRADRARTFKVQHWEYDADRIEGFDYDVGASLLRSATDVGEDALISTLEMWGLQPAEFVYPWQSDDPN